MMDDKQGFYKESSKAIKDGAGLQVIVAVSRVNACSHSCNSHCLGELAVETSLVPLSNHQLRRGRSMMGWRGNCKHK